METKLDLVNHLLQVVGERRVTSLETGHPSVVQAIQALDSWNKEFQGKGWWFNKNRDVKLLPTNTGEILVPSSALEIQVTKYVNDNLSPYNKVRYSRRGSRMYDTWLNTYTISQPIWVDIVILLDIEDLPQVAASYLKHLAAQNYYVDDDGDLNKASKLEERTMLAWHALKAAQLRIESTNALDSPTAQQLLYRIGQSTTHNPVFPGGRFRS